VLDSIELSGAEPFEPDPVDSTRSRSRMSAAALQASSSVREGNVARTHHTERDIA
jgi:hypothetical protein